ncbi:MAG: hypothetical protein QF824_04055 [Candidatus Woesearchaeota archaeon]|jgi:hypothetical protein|nr:hypothetical protein [Candidatus Woesearchaeota archaeon]
MKLQIVDVDPEYAAQILRLMNAPYISGGAERLLQHEIHEDCKRLYTDFSHPYVTTSPTDIEVVTEGDRAPGILIGTGATVDLVVGELERLIKHQLFGDSDIRHVLNLAVNDDLIEGALERLSRTYTLERKTLEMPETPKLSY